MKEKKSTKYLIHTTDAPRPLWPARPCCGIFCELLALTVLEDV